MLNIHKNQKGFTLIEILIAIAITGLITGGITTAIFQVFTGNTRTSNHMTAVRQVQNAGYWVSHDGQMAQEVALSGASMFSLTLTWTEYLAPNDEHQVVYTLLVVDKKLQRQHYTNYDPVTNPNPDATTIVAQYVVPGTPKTKCELTGGGTFTLPDSGDTFTITGGAVADNGKITVTAGSISVTTAGGATYSASTGVWTTPAAGGTVVVKASKASTAGVWTSTTASARVAITTDTNGNATITGGALIFTVTATVGKQSETRVYEVMPRPGS